MLRIITVMFSVFFLFAGVSVYGQEATSIETPLNNPTKNEEARELFNKGNTALEEKQYDDAVESFLDAIKKDPKYTDAMDNLAVAYRKKGEFAKAEEWLKKSIEVFPKNKDAYLNLGVLYRQQGKNNLSQKAYLKAIEIDPENPEGYYGLGGLYQIVKEYKASIVCLERAIQIYMSQKSPYIYDAIYLQGFNYYYIKDYQKAYNFLSLAKKEYADDKELNAMLTLLEEKHGITEVDNNSEEADASGKGNKEKEKNKK